MQEHVDRVARALELTIIERFGSGDLGAFLVETTSGTRLVLKVLPRWPSLIVSNVKEALDLLGGLRERGYPIPRYLGAGMVDDDVYTVQEFVSGEVPRVLDEELARRLLELWRMHENAAPVRNPLWGSQLLTEIERGRSLLARTSDPRVQALVRRAVDIAESADMAAFRTADIVHGDFHSANVLVRGREIAAVVDWEGARVGDYRADLVRLLAGAKASSAITMGAEALLRKELDRTTPREIWLPIGAEVVIQHLPFGLFARPDQLDWVLAEAEVLLPD